jgi:hypothetical protein
MLLSTPSVLSDREEAIFIIEKVTQQQENVINREVAKAKTEINKNMDDNYRVLDKNLTNRLKTSITRLIIGMTAGMTVVLIGYAWLISYITRKYTSIYTREMLKKKYAESIRSGKMVAEDKELEEQILQSMEKQPVSKLFKKKEAPKEERMPFEYDEPTFDYGLTQEKKKTSKIWYFILFIFALIIAGLLLYLLKDINVLKMLGVMK